MIRRQAITLLSLVGFFVSLYLLLYKWGAFGTLACLGGADCETVQASPYAEFLGLPVALWGVGGYLLLFLGGLLSLRQRGWGRNMDLAMAILSGLGFLFSTYLTGIEVFVLRAICSWCVVSYLLITAVFLLSLFLVRGGAD